MKRQTREALDHFACICEFHLARFSKDAEAKAEIHEAASRLRVALSKEDSND